MSSPNRIPVYQPDLTGNERAYVLDCMDSSWISSIGSYIERFESALAQITGVGNAISLCNGTVALHLAIHCLDIGPGDEVIVPTFTYIASVNAIAQTGATPVFVDSRESDWLIDPEKVEAAITPRTRAIMPVHLYGAICDMPQIMRIADRHGLKVVEDCAECLGSSLNGAHPGSFGDVGTFSFFGNKTITTGEGGAVIAKDDALAARLRKVKGQGQSLTRRYWHEELGFNYRMTNIEAAIGMAQAERLPQILERKRAIAARYRELASDLPVSFQRPDEGVVSSEWLVSVLIPEHTDREKLMAGMAADGVETRPVFYCAHEMPMYDQGPRPDLEVAGTISRRGISLPSFPALTAEDQDRVIASLSKALGR
ncbi:DegT/DnrJ/EryC1/StrS aminotransferase family protein [Fulvimarina endophytica]|uniref:GDP-perosamine synthase n=1 Tax=Fulvimarina endophytica TaxID=2293836 RepID=A0A371X339_9HYPH|nr:DegT/DnrJ/EryC1/StrS aminotransferase family protein [Fulvimarina endophytica]RFC63655.1 DegT/DnrJ/EryC1/StrS aminotransferase family protein [Fulvimarina endophytica]